MKHTIDTKAIQELAAMSPEVKAYLKKEYPESFNESKKVYYYVSDFADEEGLLLCYDTYVPGYVKATTEEIQRFIPNYKPE